MDILFQDGNYYTKAMLSNGLKNEEALFRKLHNKTAFQYGDVTCEQFDKHYNPEGWIGRKFTAIPLTLWAWVAQVVYHLALLLFVGLPKVFSDSGKTVAIYAYYMGRDYQEGFGHLMTLFWDQYGLSQVHESYFHKECYALILNPIQDYRAQAIDHINKKYPTNIDSWVKLDKLTKEEFSNLIPYLTNEHYAYIPPSKLSLFDLKTLTDDQLNNFFAFDENRLNQVSDEDFVHIAHKLQGKYLANMPDSKLNLINYSKLQLEQFTSIFPLEGRQLSTERKLAKLSAENFKTVVNNFFVPAYFKIDLDAHLNTIEYDKLSKAYVEAIFSFEKPTRATRDKLEKLTSKNFKIVLKHMHDYELIPAVHINSVDFANITNVQLNALFEINMNMLDPKSLRTKEKLSALSSSNFKLAFPFLKTNLLYFQAIPENQIANIPCEELTKDQVTYFFKPIPLGTPPATRFKYLSGLQVFHIFDHLTPEQKKFITEEQLQDPHLKGKFDHYMRSWFNLDSWLNSWKNLQKRTCAFFGY